MKYLVTYADTDAGGVLHHAKYLELAESGRHWWLKERNLSFVKVNAQYNCSLVVSRVKAHYKHAIYLEDMIDIKTTLTSFERNRMQWDTHIFKEDLLVCKISASIVCVDSQKRTVRTFPEHLMSSLKV